MNPGLLKFCCTFSLSILLLTGACAQQGHFIYIQTVDQKPFYVKMDKKYLNSSPTGYMIIPRLNSNSYNLILGSQKNDWPEQQFTVLINDDDKGFLLKNGGSINVVLFDLKNEQLLKPSIVIANAETYEYTERTDDFAKILAAVVNDPSIARIRVEKNKVDVSNTKPSEVAADANYTELNKPAIVTSESKLTPITKLESDSTAEGLKLTYLDLVNANTDTVKVLLPVTSPVSNTIPINENQVVSPMKKNTVKTKTDSRFIDMELQNPNAKSDSANKGDFVITKKNQRIADQNNSTDDTSTIKANTSLKMINSDCKSIATQSGFINLRTKMVAASNEGGMTKIAMKTFTSTCFTTEQIKNLGVLYLNEEERYKLYVAAYPHVSDSHNFGTLEDQLTDNYYQSRFKAMVSR